MLPKELILYTSGSTNGSKLVKHDSNAINLMVSRAVAELNLTKDDIVLNVLPNNVIGYYSITGLPAIYTGCTLISTVFEPYEYLKLFNMYKPTVIGLIPKMIEILRGTKGYKELDMSSVRYMIMGSQNVPIDMINELRDKGVKTIGNWYGSTEHPPPVFVAKNGVNFDFEPKQGYTVSFTDEGECVVNGNNTGDLFDVNTKTYLGRKVVASGKTWKTNL